MLAKEPTWLERILDSIDCSWLATCSQALAYFCMFHGPCLQRRFRRTTPRTTWCGRIRGSLIPAFAGAPARFWASDLVPQDPLYLETPALAAPNPIV